MFSIRTRVSAAVVCLLSVFMLFSAGFEARAYEAIVAEIPVCCLEYTDYGSGNYRIMIEAADERSPQPEADNIGISENGTGTFSICIGEPGTYRYRIYEEAGSATGITYDSTVYITTVYAEIQDNDELGWSVTTVAEGNDHKSESIEFRNQSSSVPDTETVTHVITTTGNVILASDTKTTTTASVTSASVTSSAADTSTNESTTTTVTTTGSFLSEIIDTVLTGDSFPAHAIRLTMLGAFLTAFVSFLFRKRRDEEDEDDD